MAVKKSTATKAKATKKAAGAKKSAPKAKAPKKTKTSGAKAAKTAKKPAAKTAKKAAVKLTDKQTEFLKTISGHGEAGYPATKKADEKSLDALRVKKLVKKGAKNKATGAVHYHVTKAGQKHLTTPASATPPVGGNASPGM
jgi:hypothetical protein